jgi:N-acetylglutamate synthase-like GNAT family acetyltransferase
VDGQLAGNCELYQRGDVAQVEHVGTLKRFRDRGVARSVILRAVRAARETGARHVFIVTDEDDWPRHLYARLGFDQIGRTWEFLRSPDGGGGVV